MKGRVTIIGLGCVGASIGLALRAHAPEVEVMGHDIEPERARQAQRMGAVHKTHWNLPAACEDAGLVILALPLPAVRDTLAVIGPHLKEGCVVTDTAMLKVPVLSWARQYLPPHVYFISGAPIPGPHAGATTALVGPDAADADLFLDGLYCVASVPETNPAAVSALLGLAEVLGAQLLFLDPLEYDGLQSGATEVPVLLAMALTRTMMGTAGWTDMRKIAGTDFAVSTSLAAGDAAGLAEEAMLNRENLARRLEVIQGELERIRQWLLAGDQEALKTAYVEAAESRAQWLRERASGRWDSPVEQPAIPSAGEQMARMLFGQLFRRPKREGG